MKRLPQLGVLSHSVAVAADVHDVAVVEDAVNERGGHDLIAHDDCAPQKVYPVLIARFRPTMVGCFWPVFFFADHSRVLAQDALVLRNSVAKIRSSAAALG